MRIHVNWGKRWATHLCCVSSVSPLPAYPRVDARVSSQAWKVWCKVNRYLNIFLFRNGNASFCSQTQNYPCTCRESFMLFPFHIIDDWTFLSFSGVSYFRSITDSLNFDSASWWACLSKTLKQKGLMCACMCEDWMNRKFMTSAAFISIPFLAMDTRCARRDHSKWEMTKRRDEGEWDFPCIQNMSSIWIKSDCRYSLFFPTDDDMRAGPAKRERERRAAQLQINQSWCNEGGRLRGWIAKRAIAGIIGCKDQEGKEKQDRLRLVHSDDDDCATRKEKGMNNNNKDYEMNAFMKIVFWLHQVTTTRCWKVQVQVHQHQ